MCRKKYKKTSNNENNNNKNICGLAIAEYLGVDKTVHYLHTITDLIRAARNKYIVRSRKSSIKGKTIGAIRNQIQDLGALFYIVRVKGHVVLLDSSGNTVVDTDPRKRDARKITHFYGVFV